MEKTIELIIIVLLLGIMAEVYLLTRPKKQYETRQISMLVDTSVLMDGRVVDLARTGFLLGQVIVPKSVLAELQLLADGSDHGKRERARSGMDVVKELQDILGDSFQLLQDGPRTAHGVDEQLIVLAKSTNSTILTLDYNLNKVAQVEGVQVLNINELAKSLRMVHLPGDKITIEVTQKGQGVDQGVGYLPDGTMVVVEHGKKQVGKSVEIEIIRSLQTDAGKMMFAKLVNPEPVQKKAPAAPVKQPSGGRRPRPQQPQPSTKPAQKSQHDESARTQQQRTHSAKPVQKPATATKQQSHSNRRPKTSAQHEAELIRLAENQ